MSGKISGLMARDVAGSSEQIRTLLAGFAGLLKMHLASEDKGLYPQLLQSNDAALKAMAGRYMNEMGGMKTAFEAYLGKWPSAASILAKPDPFRTETTALFQALGKRIDRENNELYARVDALS